MDVLGSDESISDKIESEFEQRALLEKVRKLAAAGMPGDGAALRFNEQSAPDPTGNC